MIKKIKIKKRDGVKYEGTVKIDLLVGDKICKTVYGHNEGKKPLFEFLALCLVNQYRIEQRPNFIRLFSVKINPSTQDEYLVELTNSAITHSGVSVSSGTEEGTNSEYAEASFRFLIPYTALNLLYNQGESTIDYLKLYSPVNYDIKDNPSVQYKLSEPIRIPTNSNANVQVTWTLRISN